MLMSTIEAPGMIKNREKEIFTDLIKDETQCCEISPQCNCSNKEIYGLKKRKIKVQQIHVKN